MAGAVRSHPARGLFNKDVLKKRKRVESDEDIDSDEAEGASDVDEEMETQQVPIIEPEKDNESIEEKRLRLARAYLKQLDVGEDGGGDDALGEGADSGDDAVNAVLREGVLKRTGRATNYIADSVRNVIPKATVTFCRVHSLPPTCVDIAHEHERIAVTGGKDSRIVVWDIERGSSTHILKTKIEKRHKRNPAKAPGHVGNILTVAISDDGTTIASGGLDTFVRVWDARSGKIIDSLRGHRGAINSLQFKSGTRNLFSASSDRTVKLWDLREMSYVETLFGHGSEVNGIDVLTRERAVSCGRDGTLRLYKIVEGSQLIFKTALTNSVDCVSMINEHRFVSGGDDGQLCLWHGNKKKPTASVKNAHGKGTGCDSWISSVASYRGSDLVLSGAGDGFIRFWKCEDVPHIVSIGQVNVGPGFVNGISLSEQHRVVLAAVGTEHRLGRWTHSISAKNGLRIVKLPTAEDEG